MNIIQDGQNQGQEQEIEQEQRFPAPVADQGLYSF